MTRQSDTLELRAHIADPEGECADIRPDWSWVTTEAQRLKLGKLAEYLNIPRQTSVPEVRVALRLLDMEAR
jgi:hypothetical protein